MPRRHPTTTRCWFPLLILEEDFLPGAKDFFTGSTGYPRLAGFIELRLKVTKRGISWTPTAANTPSTPVTPDTPAPRL